MKHYGHFIDGKFVDPAGGAWLDSVDPFTGEVWARIARGDSDDVNAAVAAARAAMTTALGVNSRRPSAARLCAGSRTGSRPMPRGWPPSRCATTASCWRRCGGSSPLAVLLALLCRPRRQDPRRDHSGRQTRHLRFHDPEPVGVVAALTAWNSPLGFVAQKCAPALAAGCSVVVQAVRIRLGQHAGVRRGRSRSRHSRRRLQCRDRPWRRSRRPARRSS